MKVLVRYFVVIEQEMAWRFIQELVFRGNGFNVVQFLLLSEPGSFYRAVEETSSRRDGTMGHAITLFKEL
ncbi:MAG: hypothetical protein ACUVTG_13760 [Candidatus Oleimicrobiaceae bacterium]